ncbi:MAG TPA: DUF1707 domain-containing protein [Solirubrobacteraceae bacterium]|nr:DUF1707 domain-containing protein [Solirubrobacteraceae bacterium]
MEDGSNLPAIRAGDEERERTIVLLRDAVVSGRLTLEEFSDRVGRAQLARTEHDLAELTVDLPVSAPVPALVSHAKHRAICSRLVRRGSWEIPERSSWRSLFGTIVLDLREARLAGPVVELDIHNTFGTVTVLVPSGVQLDVEGTAPFASQVIEPPSRLPPPGAPRLRIRTKGPGGTLYVRAPDADPG